MGWHWLPEGQDGLLGSLRRVRLSEVDDTGTQQIIKKLRGLASERPEDIYRAQDFGLSSNPPADSEAMLLALGGRSDRALILGGEHKDHRPKNTPPGGAVLYDSSGNTIFAKTTDGIQISAKAGKVTVSPASGQNVYLGGDGSTGTYAKVITASGPAMNVYARVS